MSSTTSSIGLHTQRERQEAEQARRDAVQARRDADDARAAHLRDVARMAEVHRGNVRAFVRQQCEAAEALVDRARKGALAAGAELVARHTKRVREEWEVTWAKRRQMDTAYSIP